MPPSCFGSTVFYKYHWLHQLDIFFLWKIRPTNGTACVWLTRNQSQHKLCHLSLAITLQYICNIPCIHNIQLEKETQHVYLSPRIFCRVWGYQSLFLLTLCKMMLKTTLLTYSNKQTTQPQICSWQWKKFLLQLLCSSVFSGAVSGFECTACMQVLFFALIFSNIFTKPSGPNKHWVLLDFYATIILFSV